MYTVTFFSYKGGVGRTLALVNTAAALAQMGRKVLIVDFDLEAPGLPTYPQFQCAKSRPGIVEYLSSYLEDNAPQPIANYIVECPLDGSSVWLLPAGKQEEESYASRLGSIDWQLLYEERHGFLLFEDMKQQWRNQGFDYVLVDSRTGHTDVGGICTRQLPDAVVILFLPDAQNIGGLATIVDQIRREALPPREKEIKIHFCPSNVPDLDDEDSILRTMFNLAEGQLQYQRPASVIHHYSSLELLRQSLFVIQRPKSRLAQEYLQLKGAIVAGNIEDKQGALLALKNFTSSASGRPDALVDFGASETLNVIRQKHASDPEVAWQLAQLYQVLGNVDDETAALNTAINGGHQTERALLRRAQGWLLRDDRQAAVSDLRQAISSSRPDAVALLPTAAERLRLLDDEWLVAVASSPSLRRLSNVQKNRLTSPLMTVRAGLSLAVELSLEVIDSEDGTIAERGNARANLWLALIGLCEFERAMQSICDRRDEMLESKNIVAVFNYAIAEWGHAGKPPIDLFERVYALMPFSPRGGNRDQCFALVSFLLGKDKEAHENLQKAKQEFRGREFSCWRYLEVEHDAFVSDLDDMAFSARRGELTPPFFSRDRAH